MTRPAADLDIILAYEDADGINKINDMANKMDLAGIIRHIERGRTVYEGEPGKPKVMVPHA